MAYYYSNLRFGNPGNMPAIKSRPTDLSVSIAYIINPRLGGIKIPKVPPAAMQPRANLGSYLNFCISQQSYQFLQVCQACKICY